MLIVDCKINVDWRRKDTRVDIQVLDKEIRDFPALDITWPDEQIRQWSEAYFKLWLKVFVFFLVRFVSEKTQ